MESLSSNPQDSSFDDFTNSDDFESLMADSEFQPQGKSLTKNQIKNMKKRDALKRKKMNDFLEISPRTRSLFDEIKAQPEAKGSSLLNFNGKMPKIVKKDLTKLKNYGELRFRNGVYHGQVENIKPNGKGRMIYRDYYVEGYFVNGMKNGYCVTVRNIGVIQEGDYKNNKENGLVA